MISCNDNGSWHGRCCCNCKHQASLRKHPWNKNKLFKGSIMEHVSYVCASPELEGRVIVMEDRQHSICEVWEEKEDEQTTET